MIELNIDRVKLPGNVHFLFDRSTRNVTQSVSAFRPYNLSLHQGLHVHCLSVRVCVDKIVGDCKLSFNKNKILFQYDQMIEEEQTNIQKMYTLFFVSFDNDNNDNNIIVVGLTLDWDKQTNKQ